MERHQELESGWVPGAPHHGQHGVRDGQQRAAEVNRKLHLLTRGTQNAVAVGNPRAAAAKGGLTVGKTSLGLPPHAQSASRRCHPHSRLSLKTPSALCLGSTAFAATTLCNTVHHCTRLQPSASPPARPVGVRSGTAVVEDILLRKLQLWAARMHTLAVGAPEAAEELVRRVRGASKEQLQQLQVRRH